MLCFLAHCSGTSVSNFVSLLSGKTMNKLHVRNKPDLENLLACTVDHCQSAKAFGELRRNYAVKRWQETGDAAYERNYSNENLRRVIKHEHYNSTECLSYIQYELKSVSLVKSRQKQHLLEMKWV